MPLTIEPPAGECHQIEKNLKDEHNGVENACVMCNQQGVDYQKDSQCDRGDAPAEHSVADILEGDKGLVQWIKHTAEPPDALQASCCDTTLTLRFLEDVC